MSLSTLLVDARPIHHPTARQRGIGRYVTGLLTGLRDIGAPVVALYGTDDEADVLADTVPGLTARRWSPQVVREHATEGTWYLATQLMLHPIPLDPVPRCVTASRLPVAAVMYDVIPYRYPDRFLVEPNARRQADLRAPLARTLDALLAISDFAGSTASAELAFPIDRVRTIGAGVDAAFLQSNVGSRPRNRHVLADHVQRYVVNVAGSDPHKNTEGLLRAWAEVERALGGSHHLVIAGAHTPLVLQRWHDWASEAGVADRVVFTGRLDDDELVSVMQGAELSVTPSIEEGFGLPVLEAAACGIPAIASNVSSLPEVLDEPAAGFDPYDHRAIADAIVRALTADSHRAVLLAAGTRAVDRWTWEHVARATVEALDELGSRWPQRPRRPTERVAVAGVLGGVATSGLRGSTAAIAIGNTQLVEALRTIGVDVVALVDAAKSMDPTHGADDRWPVRALGRFVKPWDVDHVVAVLGPAPDHVATSAMARAVPCHLWIHDEAMVGVRFGANLQALAIARSVIVESDESAALVRRAADRPCPVLVVPPDAGPAERATALVVWLADVDSLDPFTIRHHEPPVTSPGP